MKILANDYPANLPGASVKGTGGPARFASQLSQALSKQHHLYTGIIIRNTSDHSPSLKRAFKNNKTSYYEMNFPKKDSHRITQAQKKTNPDIALNKEIKTFIEVLAKEKPDLVFINGFSLHVWPLLKAAYKLNIPIVQKHAGIWHKEIAIYEDFFSNEGKSIMRKMEKDIAQLATKQVFLNSFSQKVFQKDVARSPRSKQCIIPLPTAFKTVKNPKKKKTKRLAIGVVARWDRIKNHKALLALAEELKKQQIDAKIHVITAIPETTKDELMKNRYREIIHVHTPTDNRGILNFFRSMDIALLPSHFDVSPTVILEAASQGIGTIISSNVGWVTLLKKTGNNQWIGDFKKPKQIVKKIIELRNKNYNSSLIKSFKKDHNPVSVFKMYSSLFHSIVR